MKQRSSAPTMKDVAREAGVALGTVSKVFNNIPVGEEYRRKVEEAARLLGYQVNSYARGLKANRTCSVSLILPDITTPFFAGLAQSICSALAVRGYRTILSLTAYDPEAERRCIQMVQQNRVDGVGRFREFLAGRMNGGRLAYDGIFCVNDALALRVRGFLEELGLRVPEDVQLIGFDGLRQFVTGEYFCSTIVQPVARLAETGVDLLLREDRSDLPSLVCLPVTCAAGGTTRE